jgi:hypothetical protein
MIFVFSCNRPEMLLTNVKHFDDHGFETTIIDDASTFDLTECNEYADIFQSEKKLGKRFYWMQWRTAFEIALDTKDDLFIFTPDDFMDLDLEKIKEMHEALKNRAYCFNLINDGREQSFRQFEPIPRTINETECLQVGFTDCGFFCNRMTLNILKFRIDPIMQERFHADPLRSSGVGEQLTFRMRNAGVFMLRPNKSLAFHGDHTSIMHPEERKRNPLTSK